MNKLRFITGFVVVVSFFFLIYGIYTIIYYHMNEQSLPVAATASIIMISGISLILFDISREQEYNLHPINREIGQRVLILRKTRGLSLQELSNRSSISRQTIYRLERGKHSITDYELVNLAYALEISTLYLLEGKEERDV
ncbi:helix-turn-helix domain-containing protein [Fodinisporobacter ferrooxydans]|uniref:Helix-turn-helix domain-containing protein n=1 Tax=Fodinisporobacter ferrooxydans TaxID=2901836 RepID=A0ABY4CEX2_9BACL|nr:helix-turn-helix domain-containing protein [Alicyclobacillaceae bacterium MYW30-H2]